MNERNRRISSYRFTIAIRLICLVFSVCLSLFKFSFGRFTLKSKTASKNEMDKREIIQR